MIASYSIDKWLEIIESVKSYIDTAEQFIASASHFLNSFKVGEVPTDKQATTPTKAEALKVASSEPMLLATYVMSREE